MTTNSDVKIIDFSNDRKQAIKLLNYEWLEKYFRVEEGDERSLSNPKEEIIDKGGHIFYAETGREIVGTVSLIKRGNGVFELGKMAVSENFQGLGIGKILIEHCLDFAKQQQMRKLVLYSNTQLAPAIGLYKRYGFSEVELEQGLYERANIKMEREI